ncbi:MAG TPA: hypothetical protein VFB12_07430 [Ktedonobacteraceae bacterium]|nr:hypothetical protein [Ktedonobacteraceae bacterium]
MNFRQQLDTVLRTRDVKQVRNFLIAENQWSEDVPADPEFAMWMMIAANPTFRDLHEQAHQWLESHGHAEDVALLRKRGKQQPGPVSGRQRSKGGKPSKPAPAKHQKPG